MNLKTKRAATVLAGWLEAAEIPFQFPTPTSISIDGLDVEIDDPLSVALTAPLDRAMETFWSLTERAGHGRPVVVNRGQAPGGVRYKDDPELVAMRHREFRQVANPGDALYRDPHYQRIINWYCTKFFRANFYLCQQAGYETDDVKTYAWLYLTNFYGRWRHLDRETFSKEGYGNGKMFCSYLQQRLYSDLKPLLIRKSRNIVIDAETAGLGTNMEFRPQYEGGDESPTMVAVPLPPEVDFDVLIEDLNSDHDGSIVKLEEAAGRRVPGAQQHFSDHIGICVECSEKYGQGVTCSSEDEDTLSEAQG